MAIYRYLFWLTIFSLLFLTAWLMVPAESQRPQEPTDILNISKSDVSALKQAIEAENLAEVAQELPGKLREEAQIVIQAPSFIGADKRGFKWEVTADKAYQQRDSTVLGLERIHAKRAIADPVHAVQLEAPKGSFDDQQSILNLPVGFGGTVQNMQVEASNGTYQMVNQYAKGEGFSAKSDGGQMVAAVFEADLLNETANFNGGVKMNIKLKRKAAGE